ncbi:MAG: PH domain-containing protein [Bacteroides sp.]|nr:PH domain-containing protein [Bacteroides sp.]
MNRVFHARIAAGQYLFLSLVTFITVFCMWQKHAAVGVFAMLLLVFTIERLIHTTYTVTPQGTLELYYGRFARRKTLLLKDITSVERASSMRVGRFAGMRYVLIHYGVMGQSVALLPVKEGEFIRLIRERME